MTFAFDKIKDELFSMGRDVGDKVSDVSNIAKLKLDIRSKEDFIEKQFAQLGHMYYETHKNDVESVPEQGMMKAIMESESEIESLKRELTNLQGTSYCPACGEKQQKEYRFCPKCGAELKRETASEDEIFVDEECPEDDIVVENESTAKEENTVEVKDVEKTEDISKDAGSEEIEENTKNETVESENE